MRSNLRLIHTTTPPHTTTTTTTSPRGDTEVQCGGVVVVDAVVLRVWDYWRGVLRQGMPVARALSPDRRQAIFLALTDWGFDEDTLRQAVEGCAASRWCMGQNKVGRRFDDLGWILASAERIERLAAEGQQFRVWMQREAARAASDGDGWEPKSPEMVERMAAVRAALKLRIGGR